MSKPNPVKYFHYLYPKSNGVIRIRAKQRPSLSNRPTRHTWIVGERNEYGAWVMPPCPEITWGTLSKLEYLGCTIAEGE